MIVTQDVGRSLVSETFYLLQWSGGTLLNRMAIPLLDLFGCSTSRKGFQFRSTQEAVITPKVFPPLCLEALLDMHSIVGTKSG